MFFSLYLKTLKILILKKLKGDSLKEPYDTKKLKLLIIFFVLKQKKINADVAMLTFYENVQLLIYTYVYN